MPDTPASAEDAQESIEQQKAKAPKGVTTQYQEYPGQDVPRVIEGEGETKKDKQIVEGAKVDGKGQVEDTAKTQKLNADRDRIRAEEQQKLHNEEYEKELEKIRKEEHDKAQKQQKEQEKQEPKPATANAKK